MKRKSTKPKLKVAGIKIIIHLSSTDPKKVYGYYRTGEGRTFKEAIFDMLEKKKSYFTSEIKDTIQAYFNMKKKLK